MPGGDAPSDRSLPLPARGAGQDLPGAFQVRGGCFAGEGRRGGKARQLGRSPVRRRVLMWHGAQRGVITRGHPQHALGRLKARLARLFFASALRSRREALADGRGTRRPPGCSSDVQQTRRCRAEKSRERTGAPRCRRAAIIVHRPGQMPLTGLGTSLTDTRKAVRLAQEPYKRNA
mgnify:CR=1 FL=1